MDISSVESMKAEKDVEGLIRAVKDEDGKVRRAAAKALGEIGDAGAIEALIEVLKDKDILVRAHTARALGKIGDARALKALIEVALRDKDEWVRADAKWGLVDLGESAVEPLIQALKDEEGSVRRNAADALGFKGYTRAVEPLIQALKDENRDVRAHAAGALGLIGDARAVEPLCEALKDKDWFVGCKAADALGEIGDPRAFEPLRGVINWSFVGKDAAAAIEKIRKHIG